MQRRAKLREEVLAFLEEAYPETLTAKDLTALAGCTNRASVFTMLRILRTQGLVKKVMTNNHNCVWRAKAVHREGVQTDGLAQSLLH